MSHRFIDARSLTPVCPGRLWMGFTSLGRLLLAAIAFAPAWPGGTGKVVAHAPSCGSFVDGTLMPSLSPDGNVIAYGFNPYLVLYGDGIFDEPGATPAMAFTQSDATSLALSADGRFVIFDSGQIEFSSYGRVYAGAARIQVFDRQTGRTTTVAAADGLPKRQPAISADGSPLVFTGLYARPSETYAWRVTTVLFDPNGPPLNVPPVANAGPDQTVTTSSATITVTARDAAGTERTGTATTQIRQ